ncbi:alkylation response protein AidB-like acyl-CoA dehydrogenase [Jatrophihabitans sp. GAS493]|uniref:acyl-CoA dehydrogenase family protein n=1 Tax=Jatrophihabitans sp. GAS493 TaxID=1907575 RepID=UPI000BB990CC|nr:acyl-CoA dehydrogenase family protein [Jatrophihabitans sp. GAS493]SOD72116.1 alkylation response protein AidB-like acyl-CoA dehydrogenase [Jatrophihabitans sp. GAS493]
MSDTDLTENESLLAQSARDCFSDFVDNTYLNEQQQSEDGFEVGRWKQMVDLGWTGINLAEGVGGAGGTLAEAGVVAREYGYAAFASPLLPTMRAATALGTLNDGRFDEVLTRIADGSAASIIAPPDRTLRAEALSGGGYRLSGTPTLVEWFHASTDVVLCVPLADSDRWLMATLNRDQLDTYGEAVPSIDNERIARLDLDGFELSASALTREESAEACGYALARANLLRASAMVGGAQAVVDRSAQYALVREQFGQKIGSFQAIRHHLARMVIATDAARLVTDDALTRATVDAAETAIAEVALFVAGRSYVEVVLTGAEVHAGVGTTVEHIMHHHYTRAKAMQLRAGKRANRLREIHAALTVRHEGSIW